MARCLSFSARSAPGTAAGAVILDHPLAVGVPMAAADWCRHGIDGRNNAACPASTRSVPALARHAAQRPTLRGMGSSYHQFCPVAKAMELLDERWTLLIVRELVTGSQHFNELRRGVPRMSPTLLSKRLSQLVRAGIAERHDDNGDVRYMLTTRGTRTAAGGRGPRYLGYPLDRRDRRRGPRPQTAVVGHAPQHRPSCCPGRADDHPLRLPRHSRTQPELVAGDHRRPSRRLRRRPRLSRSPSP